SPARTGPFSIPVLGPAPLPSSGLRADQRRSRSIPMTVRSWLRTLFSIQARSGDRRPRRRGTRLTLEILEDRLAPAVFNVAASDEAVNPGLDTINLTNSTYKFTAPDNYWYGPDALPAISSAIQINGNGAALQRDPTLPQDTGHAFRFFYVSGGLSGLAAGSLT